MEQATPRLRILVVDDDRFMRDILPKWIERSVHGGRQVEVVTAGAPREALARIQGQCPDVVLSDYDLRDPMNGVRLLEQVKTQCPRAVRVLFSGHSRAEIGRDLENPALHGFLEKPMRLDDMMAPFLAIVDRTLASAD